MTTPCSSYTEGHQICADGFLSLNAICHGRSIPGCTNCGTITSVPPCLNADRIEYYANDAGMPALAHYRKTPKP